MKRARPPSWTHVAQALAETVPAERLHDRVRAEAALSRGRWLVAFSGGADSLALLLLLWAHWPARRGRLTAVHFDHRLRGRKEAAADLAFCRSVCRALGIELKTGHWAEARKDAGEAVARQARHAFFTRELTRARSRHLWLGHQQDDVAETMLMRLARGSGTGGLAAPRPVQRMPGGRLHLRPLLTLKKAELVDALRAAGASWREDRTNAIGAFLRNRMRAHVIPAWLAAHPDRDALAGAAAARERLEEDDEALDAWLAELNPIGRDGRMDLHLLKGRPRGLLRRALHAWLLRQSHGSDLSRQGFECLLAAVERGEATRFSLGSNGFVVIRRGMMNFEAKRSSPRARAFNKAVLN